MIAQLFLHCFVSLSVQWLGNVHYAVNYFGNCRLGFRLDTWRRWQGDRKFAEFRDNQEASSNEIIGVVGLATTAERLPLERQINLNVLQPKRRKFCCEFQSPKLLRSVLETTRANFFFFLCSVCVDEKSLLNRIDTGGESGA